MRTSTRLALFALGLAAAFGAAAAIGYAVGPLDGDGAADPERGHDDDHAAAEATTRTAAPQQPPLGVTDAVAGYRLVPESGTIEADRPGRYDFQIEGPDGEVVTAFDELHERDLHLIVVSRSLREFAHVHPVADGGAWSVELPALQPGSYRVYTDFQPTDGPKLVLGADLLVPGEVEADPSPDEATTVVVDDFDVAVDVEPAVGEASVAFEVTRDGERVVTDPYLGAAGHLVVIRAGDLSYLHVHPVESADPAAIDFAADFPLPGRYRLFLDFAVEGDVYTASFTVDVPPGDEGGVTSGGRDDQGEDDDEPGGHDEGDH